MIRIARTSARYLQGHRMYVTVNFLCWIRGQTIFTIDNHQLEFMGNSTGTCWALSDVNNSYPIRSMANGYCGVKMVAARCPASAGKTVRPNRFAYSPLGPRISSIIGNGCDALIIEGVVHRLSVLSGCAFSIQGHGCINHPCILVWVGVCISR